MCPAIHRRYGMGRLVPALPSCARSPLSARPAAAVVVVVGVGVAVVGVVVVVHTAATGQLACLLLGVELIDTHRGLRRKVSINTLSRGDSGGRWLLSVVAGCRSTAWRRPDLEASCPDV